MRSLLWMCRGWGVWACVEQLVCLVVGDVLDGLDFLGSCYVVEIVLLCPFVCLFCDSAGRFFRNSRAVGVGLRRLVPFIWAGFFRG